MMYRSVWHHRRLQTCDTNDALEQGRPFQVDLPLHLKLDEPILMVRLTDEFHQEIHGARSWGYQVANR